MTPPAIGSVSSIAYICPPLEAASKRVPVLYAMKAANRKQQAMRVCQVTGSHKQSVTFQDCFEGGCGKRSFRFACVSVKSRCSHQRLSQTETFAPLHSPPPRPRCPSLSPPGHSTLYCALPYRCHHRRSIHHKQHRVLHYHHHRRRNDSRPTSLHLTGLSCERYTLSACFPVLCRLPHAGPVR